jgi:predicted Zn-dependent peptidase
MFTPVISRWLLRIGLLLCFYIAPRLLVADSIDTNSSPFSRTRRFELLNGLTVDLVEMPAAKSISIRLLIKQGTASPQYAAGSVSMLSALWTDTTPPGPFYQFKEAEIPAAVQTDPDSLTLQVDGPPDALEFALRLIGQLVTQPICTTKIVENARKQVVAPKMTGATSPADITGGANKAVVPDRFNLLENALQMGEERFTEVLFGVHPYGRSSTGRASVSNATNCEDFFSLVNNFAQPNRAALVVAGPVNPVEVEDLVRSKLGVWTRGSRSEVDIPVFANKGSSTQVQINLPEMEEAILIHGTGTPPRSNDIFFELTLLNQLLGGLGNNSHLRREFGRASIPFSRLESRLVFYRSGGVFQVLAQLPRREVSRGVEQINACLDSFKTMPVSIEEIQKARQELVEAFQASLATPAGVADHFCRLELFGISPVFLSSYQSRLEAVTPQKIQETAKLFMSSIRMVTVVAD